jgi:predicted metal-dependent peptidase
MAGPFREISKDIKTESNPMPNIVKLNAKQREQWDMTRSSLLWHCPAFTHILYSMMQSGDDVAVFTDAVPTAGVDGVHMFINPEFFFKHSLQERVFICAHEILHAIWDHCGQMHMHKKRGQIVTPGGNKYPYTHETANVAMDLVINDLLIESSVGRFVKGGLHDKAFGTSTDSWIDVYEKVYKDAKKGGKGPGGGGQQGFDEHMTPGTGDGKSADKAQGERSEIEWGTAIAAAAASAKAQGKLPGALERFLGKILEPEVSWEEKIQAFFARKVGSGSYDWRRPDRQLITRDIYAPGRSGFGAGHVVVAIDTSGSVGQQELDRFFAEMRGILGDVRPKRVSVVWCDAKVHKVDEVFEAEDLNGLKPVGGGGTDFRPVFDWIEKEGLEPDALVFLTDGYGSFPNSSPRYPVLWGAIVKGVKYPWGDVIDVPIKSA